MDELAKLFGSAVRVKILRLFLFNDETLFDIDTITKRSRVDRKSLIKELSLLEKISFLESQDIIIETEIESEKKGTKPKMSSKKINGYLLNKNFSLIKPLRNLLIDSELFKTKDLADRLQKTVKIKLLVLSGVFTNTKDASVDVLLVGDKIDKKEAEKAIKIIESEIGKELRYALFETEEFVYRLKMFDKLLRDIFDYPHQKVVDKLKLSNY